MKMVMYSTKKVTKTLLTEIKDAMKQVDKYGSVEIFIQNNIVTQITTRNIRKTDNNQSA